MTPKTLKRGEKGEKERAIHARPTHCQQTLNALLIGIALQYLPATQVHALDNSLEDLIEGLLDIEVVSASKRAERLIEAPTSISVVSQEEMRLTGVTNVTEALRLIPGMIISEQRNGFYDVNIRGFDLAPPDLLSHQTASKNLLVMIDNRVIYDQTWGTTPWHDISLAIEDINRIEVVRGPSSALYGPNAFTGVVHIITQRPAITQTAFLTEADATTDHTPRKVKARLNVGNANTRLGYASIETASASGNLQARLSANVDQRDRHQTSLYSLVNDEYQSVDARFPTNFIVTLGPDFDGRRHFPDIEKANDHQAVNLFMTYEDYGTFIDFDVGYTTDEYIKVGFINAATAFNTFKSKVLYANARYREDNFLLQAYYNRARTTTLDDIIFDGEWLNENRNTAITAAYEWPLSEDHLLQTEYRYATTTYRDGGRSDDPFGLDKLPIVLDSNSLAIRSDLRLNQQLRLITALNYDIFRVPDTSKVALQLAATYAFTKDLIARVNFSQANRVPFASETSTDLQFRAPGSFLVSIFAENDLILATTDMLELGLRGSIGNHTAYDLELWIQQARDYNALVFTNTTTSRADLFNTPLDTKLEQTGVTLSIKHRLSQRLNLSYSVTAQETKLNDYYSNLFEREDLLPKGRVHQRQAGLPHSISTGAGPIS